MVINLVGLLEDGSPPTPSRFNPRTTLTIPLYSDATINVTVVTPSGASVPLAGTNMTLTVKKRPTDSVALVSKAGVYGSGQHVFTLAPVDTKQLTPGRYTFDAVLVQTIGVGVTRRSSVIPLSTLVLEASATPAP